MVAVAASGRNQEQRRLTPPPALSSAALPAWAPRMTTETGTTERELLHIYIYLIGLNFYIVCCEETKKRKAEELMQAALSRPAPKKFLYAQFNQLISWRL